GTTGDPVISFSDRLSRSTTWLGRRVDVARHASVYELNFSGYWLFLEKPRHAERHQCYQTERSAVHGGPSTLFTATAAIDLVDLGPGCQPSQPNTDLPT